MIAAERVAVVLLAAGLSTRFGGDKLAAPLSGLPLGLHAARMLAGRPFAARIAIVRAGGPDFAAHGFRAIVNPDPGAGQAGSIRLGLAALADTGFDPDAVLIALADMPFVTPAHVDALLARFAGGRPTASTDGMRRSPPALFGKASFPALRALAGDVGARALLRDAALVTAPAAELADVDRPGDLP